MYYGAEDGNIYNLALLEFYYILIDDSLNVFHAWFIAENTARQHHHLLLF